MKKNRIIFAGLAVILSLLLVSCKSKDEGGSYEDMSSEQSVSYTASTQLINTSADYKISEVTLTKNTYNNNIAIKYPQLVSDVKDYSKTNELIKDTVDDFLKNQYGDDYTELTLNIDYKITLCNNSIISIVFKGMGNVRTAAHPINHFLSLNIDLKDSTKLRLQDIYNVDNEFTNIYITNMVKQTISKISDYIMSDSGDKLTAQLKNADSSDSDIYSYFTDKQLGISYDVPHAAGDHVETLINYEDLKSNLKIEDTKYFTTSCSSSSTSSTTSVSSDLSDSYCDITQEDEHYKIATLNNDRFTKYHFWIFNNNGEVMYEDTLGKKPDFTNPQNNILRLHIGGGIVTQYQFYDISESLVSPFYSNPSLIENEKIVYMTFEDGKIKLIVSDLVDKSKFYKEYERDFSPTETPYSDLRSAKFVDSNNLQVTYLTGSNYKEVTETIDF